MSNAPQAPAVDADRARSLAWRLAAAFVSRRVYASGNPVLQRSLQQMASELESYFSVPGNDHLSFALMQRGVTVAGVTILQIPENVEKLVTACRQRSIEILSFDRHVTLAELETLFALLNTDVAELTAVDISRWLQDRGVQRISVKHIEIPDSKVARDMRELYSNGRDVLGKQYQQASSSGAVELGAVAELAGTMLDLVLHSEVPVATMVALRGRDDHAYAHAMNVSVLASAQAASLGFDEALVRTIAIAGMVHDLGKTALPDEVATKRGTLNEREAELMRTHDMEGARILLRTQGGAGLEAIVAAEHHRPYTEQPHVASQIVAIADAFDSIRSLRPFTDRSSLRMALRFMLKHMRYRLNPYLMQRFCLMCGMYRQGDIVHLATGEVARVVATHPEMGSRPIIEVVETGAGVAPPGTLADLAQPHLATVRIKKEPVLAFADLTLDAVDALA